MKIDYVLEVAYKTDNVGNTFFSAILLNTETGEPTTFAYQYGDVNIATKQAKKITGDAYMVTIAYECKKWNTIKNLCQ